MKEQFPDIPRIPYEGPQSNNPLAFKFYNPDEKVGGKTMRDHLRYSIAYWQAINIAGMDAFARGLKIAHKMLESIVNRYLTITE